MALDGNFHHRHQTSSGDGPHFHDAVQIISKEQVDAVGNRIDAARKRPPRKFCPKVPEEVIQECQDSHTAADGRKAKTDMGHFDDTGLMVMVCRHDVPLFVANIDTPGEQQKYGVALMEHVLTLLPSQATCVFIIDVGCVFDVSLNKVRCLFYWDISASLLDDVRVLLHGRHQLRSGALFEMIKNIYIICRLQPCLFFLSFCILFMSSQLLTSPTVRDNH